MQLILLALELVILYVVASRLTQAIFSLTVLLTRSRTIGITVVTLLTFPGTVIHELAHLFTAEILGVKTGKLTLVPENLQESEVKTGSVMISHSDPFRRYLIGLAPILWGMLAVVTVSYLLTLEPPTGIIILYYYLLFAISASMFSSSEDLKGFVPFALVLVLMATAAYVAGLRIGVTGGLLTLTTRILNSLTRSLGIVLVLDIAGVVVVSLLTALVARLTHRRFVSDTHR